MPRHLRALAAAGAAVAATSLLTACDKPVPKVTILSGSTSTTISPLKYCFDTGTKHCHTNDVTATVHARSSSTIVVDVPREVADEHWLVSAFRLASNGKSTPLDGYGSAALLHDRHSTRVAVPFGTGAYYLSVAELEGAAQVGTWTVRVRVVE